MMERYIYSLFFVFGLLLLMMAVETTNNIVSDYIHFISGLLLSTFSLPKIFDKENG